MVRIEVARFRVKECFAPRGGYISPIHYDGDLLAGKSRACSSLRIREVGEPVCVVKLYLWRGALWVRLRLV